ncbi:hypothetical protein CQ13_28595 [Bradyrhizobium retamae]|uniref:Uncharacterized protein n=1 Tax=Bradyrhizobium retamae TaxID=1300035 RepID=A0A0R3MS68_9BRAD|nr:hypothetical protein CQ13_28595 [Bradyrhizobium retamae]
MAVAFLEFSLKLIAFSADHIEIFIGELPPCSLILPLRFRTDSGSLKFGTELIVLALEYAR